MKALSKADQAEIIQGAEHVDSRGILTFFNELALEGVKRFYKIAHPNTKIVRAWQGHKNERKWFYVLSGSFTIVLVKPDNWENPSKNLEYFEYVLSAPNNQILQVPQGYINGFKANEPDSNVMVFSDRTVKESSLDDYRFNRDLWYKWDL